MVDFLIHSAIERFALETPDNIAVAISGKTMTYEELNRSSNQLAHAFLSNGVNVQDRIGIFHHKEMELAVGIYGILKAGCVFVPLDPFMPADRLAFILEDCDIKHIVTSDVQSKTLSQLKDIEELHLYGLSGSIDIAKSTWQEIKHGPLHNPDVVITDQELGYIMYTSGSTGQPKGMMHTHHGSITYANWGKDYVSLVASDRVASHAPLHFDLSIFDFFSTARAGATVVLVPEAVTRFPASWSSYIDSEAISIVFTVPYTLTTMLEQGAMGQRDLSSLRWILFGGEPFPPGKLRLLMKKLEGVRFTNIYGPAEAPCCTCYDVPNLLAGDDEALPIGIVSRNSSDLIINENDEECAPGESGELCIRSSTLMKGYWNRPDLNAKAYLNIDIPGRLPLVYYRTGDRVYRHEDGQLRFLGRNDRMIKTRGHRVELDEVEATLAAHDSVLEAAAFTIPGEHGSVSIMAAVTPKPAISVDSNVLFKFARSKLPPYAVPREITSMTSIPHTSSGKIDRRALKHMWQEKQVDERAIS